MCYHIHKWNLIDGNNYDLPPGQMELRYKCTDCNSFSSTIIHHTNGLNSTLIPIKVFDRCKYFHIWRYKGSYTHDIKTVCGSIVTNTVVQECRKCKHIRFKN
jgi:hypothetical protein